MGTETTKKYFYKPAYKASGETEMGYFHAALDVADAQMPVFPQAYGTGIGTAEDPWTGLASAYTACPAGGTIYLRAGYYSLTTMVTIAKSINIIGEGIGKTFIVTGTNYGIKVTANNVTIKDLTIDGDAQVDGTQYVCGIFLDTIDYAYLKNIEVKNCGYYGMAIDDTNYSIFENLYAHDNYRHGLHPGALDEGRNAYNTYKSIYAWNNGYDGFSDRGNINFPDVPYYNNFDGIVCWGNGRFGIDIDSQMGGVVTNCMAVNNTNNGMYLDVKDFSFTNCFVSGNGGSTSSGLYITTSENVNFTNVIVRNNYSGIEIDADCENIVFTSCQSYDNRVTPLQRYGLEIGSTNTDISLLNCKLSPNAIGNIYNPGAVAIIGVTGVVNNHTAVAGDIQYHNGTNWVRLAKGTAGQVLTMNAGATAPEWQTP